MKSIWKHIAAIVAGLTACEKEKGPDGHIDLSFGCEAVRSVLSQNTRASRIRINPLDLIAAVSYGSYFFAHIS